MGRGNDGAVADLETVDLEGAFDPEEHDRRMQALFNEEYYGDTAVRQPVHP
jgi:hypothetical protein